MKKPSSAVRFDIYFAWMILASFYLYQYILRSAPGVLINEIRVTFGIDADSFALIGAMYYYGYSVMQIPLGVAIDRGMRKTAICSISLCILGTFLFVFTSNPLIAYFSRLVVGIGAASAFMSSIKLANDNFPASQRSVAIGATLTFGAIGALIVGKPLNYLMHQFSSWHVAFSIFAAVGIIILFLAFLYIPKNKSENNNNKFNFALVWKNLRTVVSNKYILIYSVVAIGLFTPLSVMADLWGTAFLIVKFHLTREVAAPLLMNINIGMAIGSVVIPYFSDKYGVNKLIKISSLVLFMLFSFLVYCNNISYVELVILMILIGFFCGAEMLCFTAALTYVDSKISGLTIGVVNTLNMLSGAIMQQIIGVHLDSGWSGELDDHGLRIYSIHEFVEAFSILVIIIGICTITAFFTLGKKDRSK